MSPITFFIIFIPLLASILLAINLLFAPHSPYQEKNSTFECGFHSFLGQNRTQFSISFFIFALLFLLFDLEILLVYPYVVSAYTNDIYGLIIMLIFFLVLTLGFAFELGKNALKIDSRQYISKVNLENTVKIENITQSTFIGPRFTIFGFLNNMVISIFIYKALSKLEVIIFSNLFVENLKLKKQFCLYKSFDLICIYLHFFLNKYIYVFIAFALYFNITNIYPLCTEIVNLILINYVFIYTYIYVNYINAYKIKKNNNLHIILNMLCSVMIISISILIIIKTFFLSKAVLKNVLKMIGGSSDPSGGNNFPGSNGENGPNGKKPNPWNVYPKVRATREEQAARRRAAKDRENARKRAVRKDRTKQEAEADSAKTKERRENWTPQQKERVYERNRIWKKNNPESQKAHNATYSKKKRWEARWEALTDEQKQEHNRVAEEFNDAKSVSDYFKWHSYNINIGIPPSPGWESGEKD